MRRFLAAGAILLASSIGAWAQQATFCGAAGSCSSSSSHSDLTTPQRLDQHSTAAVPDLPWAQRSGPTNAPVKPSDTGSGFLDQPIGADTSIHGQQNPSLGINGSSSGGYIQ